MMDKDAINGKQYRNRKTIPAKVGRLATKCIFRLIANMVLKSRLWWFGEGKPWIAGLGLPVFQP